MDLEVGMNRNDHNIGVLYMNFIEDFSKDFMLGYH